MSAIGFDPRPLSYDEVTVDGQILYVALGGSDYAFWVSERGPGDAYPFFVTLPGPQRPDGSRSVLGCTCQSCGGTRGEIAAGVAHECIHTEAAAAYKEAKEVESQ